METALQPSLSPLRSRITLIEAIELMLLGLPIFLLLEVNSPTGTLPEKIYGLLSLEIFLLGSWLLYNAYIHVARAGGKTIDAIVWYLAAVVTGSYTFWAWSLLDINRLIVSKLFYRGEAPVEYAWTWRSKQVRKEWERVQKEFSA